MNQCKEFMKADRKANCITKKMVIKEFFTGGGVYSFLKYLRKVEYKKNRISKFFYKYKLKQIKSRFNIEISPFSLGKGVSFPHLNCIIINRKAKIGDNACIHQFVTIGNNGKTDDNPIIGNNCFIGAGAIVIGNIRIGDNVTIGAGAVVTKDIPDNCVAIGNPAVIKKKN